MATTKKTKKRPKQPTDHGVATVPFGHLPEGSMERRVAVAMADYFTGTGGENKAKRFEEALRATREFFGTSVTLIAWDTARSAVMRRFQIPRP
ncbi:MAG TPA: hypothetical protein VJ841_02250 [Candidatus Saccharimonadales bacterium]|nr:hypothetical protein [Candidatus Saccharimonadales bacterium]